MLLIKTLTIVQADQIVKVMAGAVAEPDVVLLRNGVFLGDDAVPGLLVEFHAAAEVLLRSQA
jgi:hypothetical protein